MGSRGRSSAASPAWRGPQRALAWWDQGGSLWPWGPGSMGPVSPRAGLGRSPGLGLGDRGPGPGQQAAALVTSLPSPLLSRRAPDRHVQVKQRGSVLNMLRRLDRIRFRGHKRDDFLDLAESPNASDTECGDEIPLKIPRTSPRDSEELRDPVSTPRGPPGAGHPAVRGRGPRAPLWAGGYPTLGWPSWTWTGAGRVLPRQVRHRWGSLLLSPKAPTSLGGRPPQFGDVWSSDWISSPSSMVFWVTSKRLTHK